VQQRLSAIDSFVDEAIPPKARPWLVELRATSVAMIRDVIARLAEGRGLAALSAEEIREALEEAAARAGVSLATVGEPFDGPNGQWIASVTRSKQNPRYLIVGFDFRIPCGSDGGFVVYDRAARGAEPLLAITAPPSDTIEPSFYNATFAVPPAGDRGKFFFAVTRITPWCQSALRRMQLLVLAPSGDPLAPRRLIDSTQSHHLQKPYRLDVRGGTITWETHTGIEPQIGRWRRTADGFMPM